MTDYVGQQFGNYRLTQWLGHGGFAEIYLGEHIHMGTQAAIKILYSPLTPEHLEQFRAEARTVAQLDHPHIVRLLDFDIQDSIPFLVMSYAPYGTLRERHPKRTRVPLPIIIEYVRQVADALRYAHERQLIHRDIKPENLLLGRNNEVLLSDFGLALITQSSSSQFSEEMAGTVPYTAPEQLQGRPRRASDQYSLGIVVYEWLSGDCPFRGSTVVEMALQHMNANPPSLREQDPTIPASVEEVVMIALAKEPQRRFATIQAFANALELAARDGTNAPAHSYPPQERHNEQPLDQPDEESIAWTVRAEDATTLPVHDQFGQVSKTDERRVASDPALWHTPSRTVFLFNQRLTDPSEFFGRARDRETLRNRTRNGASTSIVGPRRIGKTWLMNYLMLVAPTLPRTRFRIGYLDASMASCASIVGFTNAALEALSIVQFVPNTANLALTMLEKAIQDLKAKGVQALLCIDEFESFGKRQEFAFDFFASLRGMTQIALSLVVASKSPLIDIVGEAGMTSNFSNVFEQLLLEAFTLEDAQEFVEVKGKQAGFTTKERDTLLHYGKINEGQWSPLRLQLVGELLHGDKLLAQRKGQQYYRPDDWNYWQEFEQRLEKKYRSVVPSS
jgi:serine/threonine protein kinase